MHEQRPSVKPEIHFRGPFMGLSYGYRLISPLRGAEIVPFIGTPEKEAGFLPASVYTIRKNRLSRHFRTVRVRADRSVFTL